MNSFLSLVLLIKEDVIQIPETSEQLKPVNGRRSASLQVKTRENLSRKSYTTFVTKDYDKKYLCTSIVLPSHPTSELETSSI